MPTKTPLHLTLRSDFAVGARSLRRHRPLIKKVLTRSSRRFNIRIYEYAVVSNHIHIVIKGKRRSDLQNFFRVVAGHIAQEILRVYPIVHTVLTQRGAVPPKPATREKENEFWQTRIYSKITNWGRHFRNVIAYVIQNELEASGVIAYTPRKKRQVINTS